MNLSAGMDMETAAAVKQLFTLTPAVAAHQGATPKAKSSAEAAGVATPGMDTDTAAAVQQLFTLTPAVAANQGATPKATSSAEAAGVATPGMDTDTAAAVQQLFTLTPAVAANQGATPKATSSAEAAGVATPGMDTDTAAAVQQLFTLTPAVAANQGATPKAKSSAEAAATASTPGTDMDTAAAVQQLVTLTPAVAASQGALHANASSNDKEITGVLPTILLPAAPAEVHVASSVGTAFAALKSPGKRVSSQKIDSLVSVFETKAQFTSAQKPVALKSPPPFCGLRAEEPSDTSFAQGISHAVPAAAAKPAVVVEDKASFSNHQIIAGASSYKSAPSSDVSTPVVQRTSAGAPHYAAPCSASAAATAAEDNYTEEFKAESRLECGKATHSSFLPLEYPTVDALSHFQTPPDCTAANLSESRPQILQFHEGLHSSNSPSADSTSRPVSYVYKDSHMGGAWTATEDLLVVQFVRQHGPKWVLLHSTGSLPSRTLKAIQNRWHEKIRPKLDDKGDPKPQAAADWAADVERETQIGAYAGFHAWTAAAPQVDLTSLRKTLRESALLAQTAEAGSLCRLLDAIASPDDTDTAKLYAAQQSEFSKVTAAGKEPTDNQWCVHVGDNRFFPVELKPLLFQNDEFKFKSSGSRNLYSDLQAVMERPAMQQWGALLELGLLPMRMASKNGELMRGGACAASCLSVAMRPPVFDTPPPSADKSHFVSLFGLDEVFSGCSDMGEVIYRGNSIIDAVAAPSVDLVMFSQLMLMHLCFPAIMKRRQIPMGVRTSSKKHLHVSLIHNSYSTINWQGESVCLFLQSCLLHLKQMFLHTQKRGSRDNTKVQSPTTQLVHCPVRVGGDGSFESPIGQVVKNDHFQYTGTGSAPTSHTFFLTSQSRCGGFVMSKLMALPATYSKHDIHLLCRVQYSIAAVDVLYRFASNDLTNDLTTLRNLHERDGRAKGI
jgi:hypothetical protein